MNSGGRWSVVGVRGGSEGPDHRSPTTDHRASTRRAFLVSSAAAVLGACGWDGGTRLKPLMHKASRFNDWFSERLFSSGSMAPKFPPESRASSFPNYHISDMTPELKSPTAWRLTVGGEVKTPLSFSIDELRALAPISYTVEHHCVEG